MGFSPAVLDKPEAAPISNNVINSFYLVNGKKIDAVKELAFELERLTDEQLSHHMNPFKNDFAVWVRNSLSERQLADRLEQCKTREELIKVINDFSK